MAWSYRFAPVPHVDYVGSSGPPTSPIYLVGEGPDRESARQRLPFVGPAGDELDRFLRENGWDRDRLFLTNLTRSYDPNAQPDADRVRAEAHYLVDELRLGQPRFVLALGRVATRWFLGDVDMEQVWGIPHYLPHRFAQLPGRLLLGQWVDSRPVVIPCYHPAAGLHSADIQPLVQHSIRRAVRAVGGGLSTVRDLDRPVPEGDYGLADDEYLDQMEAAQPSTLYLDTEGSEIRPWGLSLTWEPGVGRCILADQWELLRRLQKYLHHYRPTIVLHNSLHDLPILAAMGRGSMGLDPYRFGCRVIDTMILAYLTQIEPQGLKPLAYRHAGLVMTNYEETVLPYVDPLRLSYLMSAQAGTLTWPKPEPELVFETDGTAKVYKPQPIHTRLTKILRDWEQDKRDKNGNPVDFDNRWMALRPQDRAAIERVWGAWPDLHLSQVPLSVAVPYSAKDADATCRVYHALWSIIEAMGLTEVCEIDHSVLRMVDAMGRRGMPINPPYFSQLSARLAEQEQKVIYQLSQLAGRRINPNSSDQVAGLLFDDLGIESTKLTRGKKRSTNKKVVEGLRTEHQAVDLVVQARELNKGRTSFADPLSQTQGDRCRCRLRLTRVVSGRMAASEPNLMAIPVRTDLGLEIRNGFQAPPGHLLGTWDLDQIEMRVMADESRDPLLLDLFLTGRDIHSETASRCFGVPIGQVDKMKHRYPAKRVGFGVITGITGAGLLDQFRMAGISGWTVEACDELIEAWFKVYPGVKSYMGQCRAEARRNGVVYDRWGRPRYLPGAQSPLSHIREEAERQSHSHKIQAGAQGIMKRAMAAIDQDLLQLTSEGYGVWPLMQIHDELILEFEEGLEVLLDPMVVDRLTTTTTLPSGVPLGAKGGFGQAWGQLEK